jgi:hypothetical protein
MYGNFQSGAGVCTSCNLCYSQSFQYTANRDQLTKGIKNLTTVFTAALKMSAKLLSWAKMLKYKTDFNVLNYII